MTDDVWAFRDNLLGDIEYYESITEALDAANRALADYRSHGEASFDELEDHFLIYRVTHEPCDFGDEWKMVTIKNDGEVC